jgi:hypothetical protein
MRQQRGDFPREIIRIPQIRLELGNRYGGDARCEILRSGTPKIGEAGKRVPDENTFRATVQPRCRREEFPELLFGAEPEFRTTVPGDHPALHRPAVPPPDLRA